jgi:hypothetical protein
MVQSWVPNAFRKLKQATALATGQATLWPHVRSNKGSIRFISSKPGHQPVIEWKWNQIVPRAGTRRYSSAEVKLRDAKVGSPGPGMTSGKSSRAPGAAETRVAVQNAKATSLNEETIGKPMSGSSTHK